MEKTGTLKMIDSELCSYFAKHSQPKKERIYCFSSDKRHISQFYHTMNEHFFQQKMKENVDSRRNSIKESKNKEKILENIKNPINSSLPKDICQKNSITINKTQELKNKHQAMFSEVCCSKKSNYVIGEQVRSMVTEDIRETIKRKQQQLFQKKYPRKADRSRSELVMNTIKTENLIKTYNRIVAKYKLESIHQENTLKIIDQNHFHNIAEDISLDNNLFNLLALFKRIYKETKSEYITENLMKYIMKFQKQDKMTKKIKSRKVFSTKTNLNLDRLRTSNKIQEFQKNTQLEARFGTGLGARIRKISILKS